MVRKSLEMIDRGVGPRLMILMMTLGIVSVGYVFTQWRDSQIVPITFTHVAGVKEAPPGGQTAIVLDVNRAPEASKCRVETTMFVRDASGGRSRYVGTTSMMQGGNQITIRFMNPPDATPGPAVVGIYSEHTCTPWHQAFGPTATEYSQPFTILPPQQDLVYAR